MKEWADARAIMGGTRVLAGPQLSHQLREDPDHAALVLARYRTAAALIGDATSVIELGCGEGIGAGILAKNRERYLGLDADREALEDARELHQGSGIDFFWVDLGSWDGSALSGRARFDAAISLDVIEHIPCEDEHRFMQGGVRLLNEHGVMIVGTPSANAYHLASPQSKVGHVNNYTPERLKALMQRYFHRVIMAGMQDVSLHFGHPGMVHYVIAVGIAPR